MALEIERKFLLAEAPDMAHPVLAAAEQLQIDQAYLRVGGGEQTRVRRRQHHGQTEYYHTRKTEVRPGVREETERLIGAREYKQLLSERDPSRQVVQKIRYRFEYRGQAFELDHIVRPAARQCWLLELELAREGQAVELPDFLAIARELTDDPAYYNDAIALG